MLLSGGATVYGFSVDANHGTVNAIDDSPFTPSSAADYFAIDPSRQFLFASNANVAGFSVDASTGSFTAFTAPPASAEGVTLLMVVKSSQ
jgi:6-phosphogluconolactonase (cycloisomerase 2 family)